MTAAAPLSQPSRMVLKLALARPEPVDVDTVSGELGFSAIQAQSELRELVALGFLHEEGDRFSIHEGRTHDAREAADLQTG